MKPEPRVTVNVSNRTIVRTILWVLATIFLLKFIGRVSHPLTLIFVSLFLALALNPVVSWMSQRLKIKSRVKATAAGYFTVVAILIAFFLLVIPSLVSQTRDFIHSAPSTVTNFQQQDSSLARTARRYHIDDKLAKAARDFTSHYNNFGATLFNTGKRVVEAVASIFVVLVITFMMLVEGPKWLELGLGAVQPHKRERYKKIAYRVYKAVSNFVNGQVILAGIAGVFAFTALEIASRVTHAQANALALAGIVAVFGIIPLFGNPLAASIVVLVCLLNSASLAVIMLIYFIIYFFLESHTFQPYLQSRLNELTPLMVFAAALLGIGFAGILGAIVAIPAATTIKILLEDYFDNRHHAAEPAAAYKQD